MSTLRKILLIILSFFVGFLAVVAFAFARAKITGKQAYIGKYSMFTITSNSMEPTLKAGQIIIIKKENSYNIDDIITFKNKETGGTTTHRIINKYDTIYETKGDNNNFIDGNLITNDDILGKMVFKTAPLKGLFESVYKYKSIIVTALALTMVSLIIFKRKQV